MLDKNSDIPENWDGGNLGNTQFSRQEFINLAEAVYDFINQEGSTNPLADANRPETNRISLEDIQSNLTNQFKTMLRARITNVEQNFKQNIQSTNLFGKLNSTAVELINDREINLRIELQGRLRARLETSGEAKRILDILTKPVEEGGGNYNKVMAEAKMNDALIAAVSDGMVSLSTTSVENLMNDIKRADPQISDENLREQLNKRINERLADNIMANSNFGAKIRSIPPASGVMTSDYELSETDTGDLSLELKQDVIDVLDSEVKFF
jgi:hypothetical protein